jgi:hypothetical protein
MNRFLIELVFVGQLVVLQQPLAMVPRAAGVMIKGSGCRWVPVVAAWHGRHVLTFCSTILSMEGNQTFSRSSIFVLTMPWWPTCARSMAGLCSE